MYVVFLSFSLRPFLRITAKERLAWNALSYKWLLTFYKTLVILIFNKIRILKMF
jgi:hypothetical protein